MSEDIRQVFRQAIQAHRAGNHAGAIQLCDSILAETGDQSKGQANGQLEVLNLRAVALAENDQLVRARDTILVALNRSESDATSKTRSVLLVHAARISTALDLFAEAFGFINEAAALDPSDSGIMYQRARLAWLLGDTKLANRLVQECTDLFPSFREARMLQAQIAMASGNQDVAESCYQEIVEAEPGHARAWAGLSELKQSQPDDAVMAGLSAIHDANPDSEGWATATFAMADAHARAGAFKTAFQYYCQANQRLAEDNSWDIGLWRAGVNQKMERTAWRSPGADMSIGPKPLFIVGMPRSGSSLLERMMGAHSLVATSGERQSLTHIERHLGPNTTDLNLELAVEMRALYRKGMQVEDSTLWVCDKANRNFERVGLIQQLFPESRIIWIIRNPLDTILSCFIQDFQHGLAFTHSLEHLTQMYCGHWRLMNRWLTDFGDAIFPIHYERMVKEPETVIGCLCGFLDLEFESEMLQPHLQRGAVRTASILQVQQPIHSRSLGRWRHYHDELKDVIKKLRAEEIIDETGEVLPLFSPEI